MSGFMNGHILQTKEDLIHFMGILPLHFTSESFDVHRYYNAQEDHFHHDVRADVDLVCMLLYEVFLYNCYRDQLDMI